MKVKVNLKRKIQKKFCFIPQSFIFRGNQEKVYVWLSFVWFIKEYSYYDKKWVTKDIFLNKHHAEDCFENEYL